jgi:hypothetical protein
MTALEPAPRGRPADELRAIAVHAEGRAALYRRKVLLGRGEPRRLAELERIAAGAARRAKDSGDRRGGSP